jgi:hypothetical protein
MTKQSKTKEKPKKKATCILKKTEGERFEFAIDYLLAQFADAIRENMTNLGKSIADTMSEILEEVTNDIVCEIYKNDEATEQKGSPQFSIDLYTDQNITVIGRYDLSQMLNDATTDMDSGEMEAFASLLEASAKTMRTEIGRLKKKGL